MATFRRFRAEDLFRLNHINLDPLTENYNPTFYLSYLARWPDCCYTAFSHDNQPMAYILGKAEGQGTDWHGHVTALTVGPTFRMLGLAKQLMQVLEDVSEKVYDAFFVDLFVRESNQVAIQMYQKMGYIIYRCVLDYYSGGSEMQDEDAMGTWVVKVFTLRIYLLKLEVFCFESC
ncbi:N(alpha)-acetyltransferase 20, NatB catalytic subunit [Coelomomyces lativittatus]|nr:N(alpha)-acetyltransferase 20, NatB catalytic subunit [Coelomomyces lativittatus]